MYLRFISLSVNIYKHILRFYWHIQRVRKLTADEFVECKLCVCYGRNYVKNYDSTYLKPFFKRRTCLAPLFSCCYSYYRSILDRYYKFELMASLANEQFGGSMCLFCTCITTSFVPITFQKVIR